MELDIEKEPELDDLAGGEEEEKESKSEKEGNAAHLKGLSTEGMLTMILEARSQMEEETAKFIVGQREVVNQVLTALFAGGHCLLVGAPGLAKTLLIKTISDILELRFKRIQFTPDLMPTDITGAEILEEDPVTHARRFCFKKGPVFTNILLADEINRTPPKTQAALLEAMQERRVTASGHTLKLRNPFLVLATQNPIEQEGTYPLPEAQLDRFMFCINVEYPDAQEEEDILLRTLGSSQATPKKVMTGEEVLAMQTAIRDIPVSRHVARYASTLVRSTRPDNPDSPDFIKQMVKWGAGPRAGQFLLLGAQTRAAFDGRVNISCEDVRAMAYPVLRHRVFCNFAARGENVDSDEIVKRLLETVKEPEA